MDPHRRPDPPRWPPVTTAEHTRPGFPSSDPSRGRTTPPSPARSPAASVTSPAYPRDATARSSHLHHRASPLPPQVQRRHRFRTPTPPSRRGCPTRDATVPALVPPPRLRCRAPPSPRVAIGTAPPPRPRPRPPRSPPSRAAPALDVARHPHIRCHLEGIEGPQLPKDGSRCLRRLQPDQIQLSAPCLYCRRLVPIAPKLDIVYIEVILCEGGAIPRSSSQEKVIATEPLK
ncbi:hypothetical protein U9M48_025390 [Paspalum notatum var. saurae]|uniref:Uncharacterized protein n=1 Tax=Paspalum notatum var. saurae TaxID=547442 RepID=A0AAQ3WX21_PASNO